MGETDEDRLKAEIDSIAAEIDSILKKIDAATPRGHEEKTSDGEAPQGD